MPNCPCGGPVMVDDQGARCETCGTKFRVIDAARAAAMAAPVATLTTTPPDTTSAPVVTAEVQSYGPAPPEPPKSPPWTVRGRTMLELLLLAFLVGFMLGLSADAAMNAMAAKRSQ